jgi:hypothetical protein
VGKWDIMDWGVAMMTEDGGAVDGLKCSLLLLLLLLLSSWPSTLETTATPLPPSHPFLIIARNTDAHWSTRHQL